MSHSVLSTTEGARTSPEDGAEKFEAEGKSPAIMEAQKEVVDERANGSRVRVMAALSPTKRLEAGKRGRREPVSPVGQNEGEGGDDRKGRKSCAWASPPRSSLSTW
jgi:hypothetical protein